MKALALALFVLLLVAPAHGEILVFKDGNRMEVQSYEVRDKVVVLTSMEGKLRSLPLSVVDLDATRRANQSVVEAPIAARPGNKVEKARKALELYGIDDAARELARQLSENLGVLEDMAPKDLFDAIQEGLNQGFKAERVFDNIAASFAERVGEEQIDGWLKWLQSPVARKMVEMENASQVADER